MGSTQIDTYVESNNIFVFPYSKVRTVANSGRLLYEENLIKMVTQFMCSNGFIISGSNLEQEDTMLKVKDKPLEFNIGGYYFRLAVGSCVGTLPTGIDGSEKTFILNASITLKNSNDVWELDGQDEGNYFKGLTLSLVDMSVANTPPSISNTEIVYTLPLYKVIVENAEVKSVSLNESSLHKYRIEDILVARIDGKH